MFHKRGGVDEIPWGKEPKPQVNPGITEETEIFQEGQPGSTRVDEWAYRRKGGREPENGLQGVKRIGAPEEFVNRRIKKEETVSTKEAS
jgi:hypothetical protein